MTNPSLAAATDVRERARQRLLARSGAWRFLALWLVLDALFLALWAITTPGGYFWPVWPMLGVGIGVFFTFVNAYVDGEPSEARVTAEVERLQAR